MRGSSERELTEESCPQECGGVIRYDLGNRPHMTYVQCEPKDLAHTQVVCRAWWWWDAAGEGWRLDPNIPRFEETQPDELAW
jgi:hypothetical protein